jgi:hypothetical protein
MTMDHAKQPPHTETAEGLGYEARDARPKVLLTYAVLLTISLIVVHVLLLGVYSYFRQQRTPEPVSKSRSVIDIYEQLKGLRRAEDQTLSSYGWVDRKAGIVQIPIERAMDLVAKRGVPKGKGPRTEAELNSHHGTPATAAPKDGKK